MDLLYSPSSLDAGRKRRRQRQKRRSRTQVLADAAARDAAAAADMEDESQEPPAKKKSSAARDSAGQGKQGRFADVDVYALIRTRLPPLPLTMVMATNATTPKALVNYRARAERSAFSQTVHAVESWDGSLPADHVGRPPSVLWRQEETAPLADLDRDPEWPMAPPGSGALASNVSGGDNNRKSTSASRGPWYIPPQLERALERGVRGFGSQHVVPPPPPPPTSALSGATTTNSGKEEHLTSAQRRVLFQQNGSARGLPHRVRSVVRELKKQSGQRGFTVAQFMTHLAMQTGERLVHVSVHRPGQSSSSSPARSAPGEGEARSDPLVICLAYSLDPGGRFFLCIRWRDLQTPPPPHGALSLSPWWASARIVPHAPKAPVLEVFFYTCPCSVAPC